MGEVAPITQDVHPAPPAEAPAPAKDPAEALLDAAVGALWKRVRLWLLGILAAAGVSGAGGLRGLLQPQPEAKAEAAAPAGLTTEQEQQLGALSAQVSSLKESVAELKQDVRELRAGLLGPRGAAPMSPAQRDP